MKRFVFVRKVDDIWGADLIELQKFSSKNYWLSLFINDYRYFFPKYGWSIPLKFKTGEEVAKAFQKIFKESKPKKLWVDNGKEFYNTIVEELLEKNNIKMYSTHNDEKCTVVERWNRNNKKLKLFRYFSAKWN